MEKQFFRHLDLKLIIMLNSKFNIYRNEWLELVFADRNHAYGAYVLRRDYEKTLAKSLFFAMAVLAVILLSLFVKSPRPVKTDTAVVSHPVEDFVKVAMVELPPIKQEAPPAKTAGSKPLNIETKRFVPLRVVPLAQVMEEVPSMEELEKAVIGQINSEGEESGMNGLPLDNSGTGGEGISGSDGVGDNVYTFNLVEKYPEFPGGMNAFAKYLQKNLRYPASALENGISGRVTISFIVEKDGRLSDIKIIKGIGFGCDEEAMRVLKKSPLWIPGIQNKQKVRVQYIMPIVFRAE